VDGGPRRATYPRRGVQAADHAAELRTVSDESRGVQAERPDRQVEPLGDQVDHRARQVEVEA